MDEFAYAFLGDAGTNLEPVSRAHAGALVFREALDGLPIASGIDLARWSDLSDAALVRLLAEIRVPRRNGPFWERSPLHAPRRRAALVISRGVDEARRRRLLPGSSAEFSVVVDDALAQGVLESGEDGRGHTLVSLWAAVAWPEFLVSVDPLIEAIDWLRAERRRHVVAGEYTFRIGGIGELSHELTVSLGHGSISDAAPFLASQLNEQAHARGVPYRVMCTSTDWSGFDVVSRLNLPESLSDETIPHAPPIGRGLARRLGRGRR